MAVRWPARPPTHQQRIKLELDGAGQSLIEFLLLLPFLLAISILVIRANGAIQVSIVNQQYARAQAHFLTFNSPVYPDFGLSGTRQSDMAKNGINAITLGVSDKAIEGGEEGQNQPEATMQMVARSASKAGPKPEAQQNSEKSGWVRVRNTITLCTGSHSFSGEGGPVPMRRISEGVRPSSFRFCREAIE
jgi:hypothetical protein